MTYIRILTALAATLALGACVAEPPPGPAAMVVPGQAKTAVAFQQDQTVCQQHAITHQGYGTPTSSPPPVGSAANPTNRASAQPTTDVGFTQCMAARGNAVQMIGLGNPYAYGSLYPYAYSSAPVYPYPPAYPYLDYTYAYGYPGYGVGLSDALVLGAGGYDPGSSRRSSLRGAGFQGGFRGPALQNGFHNGGFQNGLRGPGVQNAFLNGGFQNGFRGGSFQNGFRGPGVQNAFLNGGSQNGFHSGGFQSGLRGPGVQTGFSTGGFQNGSGGFHGGGHR